MVILLFKWLAVFLASAANDHTMPSRDSSARHPLFISVTEMNYNATDKNMEISCKLFTDDFEKTLAAIYHTKVDLSATANKAELDKLVKDYIKNHLQLKLDNKAVTLEFVGFEKENEAVWSYFQVSNTAAAPKKIDITNSILYESYDKQINLMHVSVAGNRKSTRLNYPDKEVTIQF